MNSNFLVNCKMQPVLIFLSFLLLMAIINAADVIKIENLDDWRASCSEMISELEQDPIVVLGDDQKFSTMDDEELPILVENLKELKQKLENLIKKVDEKMKQLEWETQSESDEWNTKFHALLKNFDDRLKGPLVSAIKECVEIDEEINYGEPMNDEIINKKLSKIRSIIVGLHIALNTLVVEIELDSMETELGLDQNLDECDKNKCMFGMFRKFKLKLTKIAIILQNSPIFCPETPFKIALAQLDNLKAQIESVKVSDFQRIFTNLIVETNLGTLENEINATMESILMMNSCIGKEFQKLNEIILDTREQINDRIDRMPLTEETCEFAEKVFNKLDGLHAGVVEKLKPQKILKKLEELITEANEEYRKLEVVLKKLKNNEKKGREYVVRSAKMYKKLNQQLISIGMGQEFVKDLEEFWEYENKDHSDELDDSYKKLAYQKKAHQKFKTALGLIEKDKKELANAMITPPVDSRNQCMMLSKKKET